MTALTVWKFDTATGAGQALAKLEGLQKQQLIEIAKAFGSESSGKFVNGVLGAIYKDIQDKKISK